MCLLAQAADAASVAKSCISDLDAIPAFLLENDAGAKDHLAHQGQAHFDAALAAARKAAAHAQNANDCNKVLNDYLKAWRNGHLWVEAKQQEAPAADTKVKTAQAPAASRAPTLELLSPHTMLLTLPSFFQEYSEPLSALLKNNRKELAAHPNWIIDVRDNGGGSDSTYAALIPWLLPDERVIVGAEWLATPANIHVMETMCSLFAPGDKVCKSTVDDVVRRMRSVQPGSYAAQADQTTFYVRDKPLEPHRPQRVAVLMDEHCGSSCEQFLLDVRQSFNVKLLGRHSAGSLDYSNLVPHDLPSGQYRLRYAISRSKRIPHLPVDVAGVLPDIYLPSMGDGNSRRSETIRVQHWLEGGSLAPTTQSK
jgi:C-terminal processing protease CtpA/Prc